MKLIVSMIAIGFAPLRATAAEARDFAAVQVFAAASLENALGSAIIGFRKIGGGLVKVSYGSSAMLAQQIDGGAAADIFISADEDWMNDVQDHHEVKRGTRFDFLSNELVLVEPIDSTTKIDIRPGFPLGSILGEGRLALADPDSVPAGKYGKAALENLGVWNAVANKLVRVEDVRAALQLVSAERVQLGIVYRTDANSDSRVKVVGVFPDDTHPAIIYPAALMANSDNRVAARFLDYLHTDAAKAFFTAQGFVIVAK